jgi:hypothetical protein
MTGESHGRSEKRLIWGGGKIIILLESSSTSPTHAQDTISVKVKAFWFARSRVL